MDIETRFLVINCHVLKLIYLLTGVASADPPIGHGAVLGRCEMVK